MLMLNRIHRIPNVPSMRSEMNDLFNAFVTNAAAIPARGTAPAMNVWEDESNYFIEAELPGFKMNDIDVSVLGDEITIKGQRMHAEPQNATFLRRERRSGQAAFTRSFALPNGVQADKVEASLTDGVLLITLPKTPAVQPRRITVKGGK